MSADEQRRIVQLEKEIKTYRKFLARLERIFLTLVNKNAALPDWVADNKDFSPVLKKVLLQLYKEERYNRKAVYALLYKQTHQVLYGKSQKTRKKRNR